MSWNLLTPHCVQISLFSEGFHPCTTAAPFASFFSFSDIGDLASLPNMAVIEAIVTSMTYVTAYSSSAVTDNTLSKLQLTADSTANKCAA